jgi:hypothetical protein
MSNQRISSLPRKSALAADDLLPLVDSQYGTANYINKKTTVGDLISITTTLVDVKIGELNPVFSVNGQGGNVLLSLTQLGDTAVATPAAENLLMYDVVAAKWTNKSVDDITIVLDCGEF